MRATIITVGILLAFFAVVIGGAYYAGQNDDGQNEALTEADQEQEITLKDNQVPAGSIDQIAGLQDGDEVATITTTEGDIVVRLFPGAAPETVTNFSELAKSGMYSDVPFHRVIDGFMIQTGDFEKGDGTGGYSYKGEGTQIDDEFHPDVTHIKGAVSMANSGPNTNGSQFFIVESDDGTPHLNNLHSVFGQVVEGIDVVEKIASAETGENDKPKKPIRIESISLSTHEG